jgi:ribosomal protein S18 acetylase RimI-like enzyme
MNSLRISRATPEDAAGILLLQRAAYESEARLYNDWSIPPLTQTLAQLQEEIGSSTVLKAVANGELLGSVRARCSGDLVHIGRLVVVPAMQRQGLGSALLKAIESEFPAARHFQLFTGSLSTGNIRLYQRHGYSITHEQAASPGVTLVFMRKPNLHTA